MDNFYAPLELKFTDDDDTGTFEGYGSVFGNLDRDGDIVAKGAFSESLKARMPALLWQHDQKSPIGRFDVVREDARGLYVKGRLSMKGRGDEAYDLLKMGALNGLSIGFVTKEAKRSAGTGFRTIIKADLMEVSLVTFPANELATVQSVKSLDARALEAALRSEIKLSKRDAVSAVALMKKHLRDEGEILPESGRDGSEMAELAETIRRNIQAMKG